MRTVFSKLTTISILFSASCIFNIANAGLIFSEDFSGGSSALKNSLDVTWADTSGNGFEVYSNNGASARGMSGFYDHDNNPSTAQIALPGAIEVNDDKGNELLTATFTLNSVIENNQQGLLTFFGGVRNTASGASVEVYNLTQDMTLSGILTPMISTKEWTYNSLIFDAMAANIGDELQIRWQGGGSNSANGQEVALVNLSVVNVPEPSTLVILSLALIGFGVYRFKK